MSDISPATRLAIRDDVMVQAIDDELIVLDARQNHYFGLNESGRDIWQALADGKSVGEAAEALTEVYDVTLAQAERDATALAAALVDKKLATICADA